MQQRDLPREIRKLLAKLRRRIRGYVLAEGLAWLAIVACLLFWLSLTLDASYFHLTRLELPRGFRLTFDVLAACLLVGLFCQRVVLRQFRRLRDPSLALLLERRFPQLQDRLITAVEMPRLLDGPVPALTQAMLERTVQQLRQVLPQLRLSDVFATQRLGRLTLTAVVLTASVGVFVSLQPPSAQRWVQAYVQLQPEYWQRQFRLRLKALDQTGQREREFLDRGTFYEYKHARGEPLTVLVEPVGGSQTPDLVELAYRVQRTGSRGRVVCSRLDDTRFRHAFGDLYDDLDLWVFGGDYTNRKPYHVTLVEPPHVDRVWLDCRYPEYLRRTPASPVPAADGSQWDRVPLLGRQISLPAETAFVLRGQCNKPLVALRLKFADQELELRLEKPAASDKPPRVQSAVLKQFDRDGNVVQTTPLPAARAQKFVDRDRQRFQVPFVLSRAATEAARQRIEKLTGPLGRPFVMPPDCEVRMTLEDDDGILSTEPARFRVNAVPDEPPVVETELAGVGTSITRKAVVPVKGVVRDDNGVVAVRFQYRVDDAEQWTDFPFQHSPEELSREVTIGGDAGVERFPVGPLDLQVGQHLTLTVVAEDADNLNGPHVSHGEKYAFRIVTTEELLSILYQRELNLRQRFEQVLEELKDVRGELRTRQKDLSTPTADGGAAPDVGTSDASALSAQGVRQAVAASSQRALQVVRKSSNETAEIEAAFQDIRAEAVNNGIETSQMLERLDRRIIAPLHDATSNLFPSVDDSLRLLEATAQGTQPLQPPLRTSLQQLDTLIGRLEQVLHEMHRLETFQEVLEALKTIIKEQQQLAEKTKSQHKKRLIERLKGLGLEPE